MVDLTDSDEIRAGMQANTKVVWLETPTNPIMAVADIFTAITEDRPYRSGMSYEQAANVLRQEVADGAICPYVVDVLMENYDEITSIRQTAQQAFRADYNQFLHFPGADLKQATNI